MYLILNTGRAGSTWFRGVLSQSGYAINHESLGEQGGCGSPMIDFVADNQDATVLHMWRDPLSAVNAFTAFNPNRWNVARASLWLQDRGVKLTGNSLGTFMRYWYEYNSRAYAMAVYSWPLHRVNNKRIRERIQGYFSNPIKWDAKIDRAHKDHVSNYTRADLFAEDHALADEMFAMVVEMERSAR